MTASEIQSDLVSNPYTVTHTSNGILDQTLLSCQTIREVYVLSPSTNPIISAIEMAPQTLLTPVVQEISADMAPGNVWTNRTLWQISRTGVDRSIPISTPINSVVRKTSTPDFSDSAGTRVTVETSGTSTAPSSEAIWKPGIGNKIQ